MTRHTWHSTKREVQSPKTRSRARCKGERRGFHPFGADEIRFTRCLEILRPPDTFSRCMPLILRDLPSLHSRPLHRSHPFKGDRTEWSNGRKKFLNGRICRFDRLNERNWNVGWFINTYIFYCVPLEIKIRKKIIVSLFFFSRRDWLEIVYSGQLYFL